MKNYTFFALVMLLVVSAFSCKKGDDTHLDYYKNKDLRLEIKTIDLDAGDNIFARVGAMAMTENASSGTMLTANGVDGEHKYIDVNTTMALNWDVNINTTDKAWQFIVNYDFKANGTPYTIILTPYFNDVAQTPSYIYVANNAPKKGTVEFKTYE